MIEASEGTGRADHQLMAELFALRDAMLRIEADEADTLASVAPACRDSARNLLHFIVFHSRAHPGLARALRDRGLSSLIGCDAHLLASVTAVIEALECMERSSPPSASLPPQVRPASVSPNRAQARAAIQRHCDHLFGPVRAAEAPSIMVTLPAEAARRPGLIRELVEAGMSIARINCAHDGPPVWRSFVEQVRQASAATGRPCRIAMDLAGPKLRTGALPSMPGVLRVRPRRDRLGRLLKAGRFRAVPVRTAASAGLDTRHGSADAASAAFLAEPSPSPESLADGWPELPTLAEDWRALAPGDRLVGVDASGRRRELEVTGRDGRGLLLRCTETCHLTGGLVFEALPPAGGEGAPPSRPPAGRLVVAELPPVPGERRLRVGDTLWLTDGTVEAADAIPCSLPEVFADVREGERVLFDDGKIGAVIREVTPRGLRLEITAAKPKGSRLRADKGINFPDSHLHTPALTGKDMEDLAFACRHAVIINYSFVHRVSDIEALHRELRRHGRGDLGVVLKIETRRAFVNLPRLLLAAMCHPAPIGVMIARGDLAIECGWEDLAEIQEEILRICEAAHVPCIWATQVLDEMARHGTPTRAEITDAAVGARAEALMLNKGPNITATVRTLLGIVHRIHPDLMASCLAFRSFREPGGGGGDGCA